jgi:ubiquinone/menaquinone biosynthesis C-methylase UbiE
MSATGGPAVSPERIMQFAWGYAAPLMLEAGVRNGVFDLLDTGSKTLEELARETGASVRGLRALLNGFVGFGMLTRDSEGRFGLTPESATFLVRGRPGYLGGLIRHTSTQLIPAWMNLAEIVKTGKPARGINDESVGTNFFHEFVNDIFPLSYGAARALAKELDFGDRGQAVRILDLAAGSGVWGITLAESSPRVNVTAVDWPGILDLTRENAERRGLGSRFSYVAGDLASVDFGRGYDVAVLGHILHSEGEQRGRALLRKTFDALAPGGTIAIQEFLVEKDRSGPPVGLIFAVNMLVNTDTGDTWSFEELAGWLEDAGYEEVRSLKSPGPSPLILANRPA